MRLTPEYKRKVVHVSGMNPDIISTIHRCVDRATEQVRPFVKQFDGGNAYETARRIWSYLKRNITYKADPQNKQDIRLPVRFMADKTGDCKSYSLFTVAIMRALGYPVSFRYASYNRDKVPTHVYAITRTDDGREVIIDGVYSRFNAEAPFKSKIDYPMEIAVLSGVPNVAEAMQRRRRLPYKDRLVMMQKRTNPASLLFFVIGNELMRIEGRSSGMTYSRAQLDRYASAIRKRLSSKLQPVVIELFNKELFAINNGKFTGVLPARLSTSDASIQGICDDIAGAYLDDETEAIGKIRLRKFFKKAGKAIKKTAKKLSPKNLFRAVKTVGLAVPRKAFLSMVQLNVRGLATRMSKLSNAEISDFWKSQGGKPDVLLNAVWKGKSRRPLFGASKRVKAIRGMGYVVMEPGNGMGITGAEIGAIVAAAAPILIVIIRKLKSKGIPEESAQMGEDPNFQEAVSNLSATNPQLAEYYEKAVNLATQTGIIPEKPMTSNESLVDAAIPGNDHQSDPGEPARYGEGSSMMPLLLLGGGLLLFSRSRK